MKVYTLEEMLDMHFGKKGTPQRDEYEAQMALDIELFKNSMSMLKRSLEDFKNVRKAAVENIGIILKREEEHHISFDMHDFEILDRSASVTKVYLKGDVVMVRIVGNNHKRRHVQLSRCKDIDVEKFCQFLYDTSLGIFMPCRSEEE